MESEDSLSLLPGAFLIGKVRQAVPWDDWWSGFTLAGGEALPPCASVPRSSFRRDVTLEAIRRQSLQ
jgi:hypothetical protein